MKPIFIDFHVHTSENPNAINASYDVDALKVRVENFAGGEDYLVSLTDHNVINKDAYLRATNRLKNVLVGVELHVRNFQDEPPYHCHALFNLEPITADAIDDLNVRLDALYPNKVVDRGSDIPRLDDIMNGFDGYEFLLLPHGGQNHSTFDTSIPDGVQFDRTLERNIYYNHFDGFTARSNKKLDKTLQYFTRLGIRDFVHLVTATDNYNPAIYPHGKAGDKASEFVPTWMLSRPTFDGVRLALSESSRLHYGKKPDLWSECIQYVQLNNDSIDIDVELTPGLNVVIGGSSSGKSLFVDSVHRKIVGGFGGTVYGAYGVEGIFVDNPTGQHPHYLDQNYISRICDPKDKENQIHDISILKTVFPSDDDEREQIDNALSDLRTQISNLVQAVKDIHRAHDAVKRIPKLSRLIVTESIQANPLMAIKPDPKVTAPTEYTKAGYDRHVQQLTIIDRFLSENPLVRHDSSLAQRLVAELQQALQFSQFERDIRTLIDGNIAEIDDAQDKENREVTTKRKQFQDLLDFIRTYLRSQQMFYAALRKIASYKIKTTTKTMKSMGHSLFIDNEFELTGEKFLEVINRMLKREYAISSFSEISPESLFQQGFSKRSPKVDDYDGFARLVSQEFGNMNKKSYRITTREGKDFDSLSAGWKTSVILDLILGWDEDTAPLIIDQPEDNLATHYINHGLLSAIKKCKTKKQIVLVSHNATIPMLGDAQNVILCKNDGNKITIRSDALEGAIDGDRVVDHIAKITDGGKPSIKKRVKKYNLKNFREDD